MTKNGTISAMLLAALVAGIFVGSYVGHGAAFTGDNASPGTWIGATCRADMCVDVEMVDGAPYVRFLGTKCRGGVCVQFGVIGSDEEKAAALGLMSRLAAAGAVLDNVPTTKEGDAP